MLITVEVPAETGARLEALAGATAHSRDALVLQAIERLVAEEGDRLARVAAGSREAETGEGVEGEQVHAWMRSWYTDDELPRP